jgi:hypothetical protein
VPQPHINRLVIKPRASDECSRRIGRPPAQPCCITPESPQSLCVSPCAAIKEATRQHAAPRSSDSGCSTPQCAVTYPSRMKTAKLVHMYVWAMIPQVSSLHYRRARRARHRNPRADDLPPAYWSVLLGGSVPSPPLGRRSAFCAKTNGCHCFVQP